MLQILNFTFLSGLTNCIVLPGCPFKSSIKCRRRKRNKPWTKTCLHWYPRRHAEFVEFSFGSRTKNQVWCVILAFARNFSIFYTQKNIRTTAMPEQQIPAEDRPSSSSSSEPAGGSLGHSPEELRGEANGNEFVAIRNLINSNRSTTRHRPRPPVPRLPFESFIPAPMRYYPIVIPAEPTIEDLLVSSYYRSFCNLLIDCP